QWVSSCVPAPHSQTGPPSTKYLDLNITAMSGVCSLVATFVVPGVGGLIVNVLSSIIELCQELEENEEMCTAVYKRLQVVSEELSKISDEEAMRQNRVLFMYGNTIANFLKFLQKQAKKSFIRRLAGNRKVVAAIQVFNEDIDELYKLLTVVHIQEMAKWKREWDEDRRKQEQKLLSMATNHQRILADIRNQDNNLVESLAMLKYEMTHKKAQNSMAALAMMKRTFNKITRTSGAKVPAVPEWFISSDDVDFDVNDQFDCGSYGSVTRGTWGKGAKVVIKSLLMDDDQAKQSFFKEVEVWRKLNNPHVVELFGACHVSTPAFFVCEDAIHGNFADHFMEDKANIWKLFHQAAVGLDYIHSQKVVHGDLKCNNIVIGADDNAKICDFGFSYIRSQSVGLSKKAQTDTVRWKAPECLMPMGEEVDVTNNPRFASDVYSFGMCIIEAFSDAPPFALDDDDTILEKLFSGEEYPRPEGIADDEWELVKRLTDPDWEQRISLSTAIAELKMFADRENERNNVDKTDRVCPGCNAMVGVEFAFCGTCGFRVGADTVATVA
ncbi:serine/threonine protein kinase, partial [Phytophthora nicotianae]